MKTPSEADYYRIQEIMFEIEKCIEVRSFEFIPNGTWIYDKIIETVNNNLLISGWKMETMYRNHEGSEQEFWTLVPNV